MNSLILIQGYENILKTEISTKKYSLLKYCLYCKMIVVDVLTYLCNDYSEAFLHKLYLIVIGIDIQDLDKLIYDQDYRYDFSDTD